MSEPSTWASKSLFLSPASCEAFCQPTKWDQISPGPCTLSTKYSQSLMPVALFPASSIASRCVLVQHSLQLNSFCPILGALHCTMGMLLRLSTRWIPHIFQRSSLLALPHTLFKQLCHPTRTLCFVLWKNGLPSVAGSKRQLTELQCGITWAQCSRCAAEPRIAWAPTQIAQMWLTGWL